MSSGTDGLTESSETRSGESRSFLATNAGVLIFWLLWVLLWLSLVWPGWFSPDSTWIYRQAQGAEPINDWHPAILTYVWSLLAPNAIGPIGPLLVANLSFWIGLLFVVLWLKEHGVRHVWLLFPLSLLIPSTWILGWIWKDAALVGLVTLALGVAAFSDQLKGSRWRTAGLLTSSMILGLAASIRLNMSPVLLLGAISLAFVFFNLRGWRRLALVMVSVTISFAIPLISTLVFVKIVVNPQPTYPESPLMLLDLARAECGPERIARDELGDREFEFIPGEFVVGNQSIDICDPKIFDPYFVVPIIWGDAALTPQLAAVDKGKLQSAWQHAWADEPLLLLKYRIGMLQKLLVEANEPYAPGAVEENEPQWRWKWFNGSLSESGSIGLGDGLGWPSAGNPGWEAASWISKSLPASIPMAPSRVAGLIWVVVVPSVLVVLALWRGFRGFRLLSIFFFLSFPLLWSGGMSFFASAVNDRYIAPAIAWSFLAGVIVLLLLSRKRHGAPGETWSQNSRVEGESTQQRAESA